MVLGSHAGVPCGLDMKSQSLVIESFPVGSRALLMFRDHQKKSSTFRLLFFVRFYGYLCLGGFAGNFEYFE